MTPTLRTHPDTKSWSVIDIETGEVLHRCGFEGLGGRDITAMKTKILEAIDYASPTCRYTQLIRAYELAMAEKFGERGGIV